MKRNAIFFFFTIEDAEREGAGVGGWEEMNLISEA